MILQTSSLAVLNLIVHVILGLFVSCLDVLLDRADLIEHLSVGAGKPLHFCRQIVLLLIQCLNLGDLLTLLSIHLLFPFLNPFEILLGNGHKLVQHEGRLPVCEVLDFGEMVLYLLLPLIVCVELVIASVHLSGGGAAVDEIGCEVLIKDYLRAVQIDLFRLLDLTNLIPLQITMNDLKLSINATALLMPFVGIYGRVQDVLGELGDLVALHVSDSCRVEALGVGCPSSCDSRRVEGLLTLPSDSYRAILLPLRVEEL